VIPAAEVALLLGGFAYAAASDLRDREVADRLWQLLGIAGLALGAVAFGSGLGLVLWVVVGALTLQHMFAWDDALGTSTAPYADLIEGAAYALVIVAVAVVAVRYGIGDSGVPIPVLALLFTVLFARGLFEAGILYGGADAKALMIAGLLLPVFSTVLVALPPLVVSALGIIPFSVNLLMNAALFSVAIPIGIGLRNARRGEFRFPGGFSGYRIPVRELPHRYVWLRDPLLPRDPRAAEAETSEEDRAERSRLAGELTAKGVDRVWVTPQIPFLVLMALGSVAALVAGNLVLDLIAVL
jgi:archaeal preflagellin peptidase FlaK